MIFRDKQGNEIARYSEPNGWSFRYTPEENAQLDEFNALWEQALSDAGMELGQEPRQIPAEETGISFLV